MSVINLYKEHPETYAREILGTITESQLNFLIDNLEEEFEEDEECFISADTIDYLKKQGADKDLIAMLDKALAGIQDDVEICYVIE
jgi:hypothetical protein